MEAALVGGFVAAIGTPLAIFAALFWRARGDIPRYLDEQADRKRARAVLDRSVRGGRETHRP